MADAMIKPLLESLAQEFHCGGAPLDVSPIELSGVDQLPSWFDVTDFAAEAMGFAGLMLSRYAHLDSTVCVDRRLASLWYDFTLRPNGWELPGVWDSLAGVYRAQDAWIRLHTNAPHHRQAALSILGEHSDKTSLSAAVAEWQADALESAIVDAGGCAARMRSIEQWRHHPQGISVAAEPLIIWNSGGDCEPSNQTIAANRPLEGLRVLDLTRVLAGPVAGRFLAAYGAEVLRIDPPDWNEPGVIPEVTLGKRCAQLDLTQEPDRAIFTELVKTADLLLHGYRPGALEGLGFSAATLRTLNPRLIDVSLNAYGWSGPWSQRRGFDSLVQMSCGIAEFGMSQAQSGQPEPLPVQALDHATGYLIAGAALHALKLRREQGKVLSARLSLARSAHQLCLNKRNQIGPPLQPRAEADLQKHVELTAWGPANRVRFPLTIAGTPAHWDYPAKDLRTASPTWKKT